MTFASVKHGSTEVEKSISHWTKHFKDNLMLDAWPDCIAGHYMGISPMTLGVFHGKEAALLLMFLSKKHTEYSVSKRIPLNMVSSKYPGYLHFRRQTNPK